MDSPQEERRERSRSRDEPPYLSELMNTFVKMHSDLFIKVFDSSGDGMRRIVKELQAIADEVKQMQERNNVIRTSGAVVGGAGLGVCAVVFGLLSAPLTGGVGLAAAAAAVGVGFAVVGVNITKTLKETGSAMKVEELGKEFMKIVGPLKNILEDIQMTCEKLEEKSSTDQAGDSLTTVEDFQRAVSRVTELEGKISETLFVAVALSQVMNELLMLIVNIFRVIATPEQDKKLTDAIIQSAAQSQEVIDTFNVMKQYLRIYQQQQTETSEMISD